MHTRYTEVGISVTLFSCGVLVSHAVLDDFKQLTVMSDGSLVLPEALCDTVFA